MTNLNKQIFSVLAAGTMVLNIATPALAGETSLEISGNGAHTDNVVKVETENKTEVKQENKLDVNNNFDVKSNTGKNNANDNGSGNVEIKTGNADTTVKANTAGNSNVANTGCCANNDTNVKVSGNLEKSDNSVYLDQKNKVDVDQDNDADVDNDVDVDSNTGKNYADDNIGGNVKIDTGNASTTVEVSTMANSNWARVGGDSSDGGSLTAYITGNGAYTDNVVDLDFDSEVDVDQDNDADVDNDVDVDANTGENGADDNGAGDVIIKTGNADADVTLDTMVNFNAADVDCGCLFGSINAKIAQNLEDSYNTIRADFDDELEVEQDNDADVDNDVDVDGNTGENDADDNISGDENDPSITTGNTDTTVEGNTSGNSNAFGVDLDDMEFELPNGTSINFSIDLDAILDWLASH